MRYPEIILHNQEPMHVGDGVSELTFATGTLAERIRWLVDATAIRDHYEYSSPYWMLVQQLCHRTILDEKWTGSTGKPSRRFWPCLQDPMWMYLRPDW